MNFYFCEHCGKRLTERDLAAGQAKDKKLKGVYCAACASGVLTMETLPLSDAQAREVLGKAPSAARVAPAARTTSKTLNSAHRPPPAPPPSRRQARSLALGLGALVLSLGLAAALAWGATRPSSAPQPGKPSAATAPAKSSVDISAPSSVPLPTPPSPAGPAVSTLAEPAQPVSRERAAQEAFERLARFEGVPQEDKEERRKRIQDFIQEFEDTLAASRARVLLAALDAPPAPEPAPHATAPGVREVPLAFKETFDLPGFPHPYRFEGEPPPGTTGQVARLLGPYAKCDLLAGNYPAGMLPGGAFFKVSAGARLRFRYLVQSSVSLYVALTSTGGKTWQENYFTKAFRLEAGGWKSSEAGLAEFKQVASGTSMPLGKPCAMIRFHSQAQAPDAAIFLDDVEILPEAGAAPALPLPAPPAPPAPPAGTNISQTFKENFDTIGFPWPGLVSGPDVPETAGKALLVRSGQDPGVVNFFVYPHDTVPVAQKPFLFQIADGAKFRFRYFTTSALRLRIAITCDQVSSADDYVYGKELDLEQGGWKSALLPLNEFLCAKDKHPLAAGQKCIRFLFRMIGDPPPESRVYVDDIEVAPPEKGK